MRDFLQQIESGLRANLYYLSLMAALSIPDMCAALSSLDGQTTSFKYADWFDENVAAKYGGTLNGRTCYQFRCSLLHQGTTQHPGSAYSRIIFLEPSGTFAHNNVIEDALNIDVRLFCLDLIAAANDWLVKNEGTETFKANFPKFIRRYPYGIAPYIVGAPVVG